MRTLLLIFAANGLAVDWTRDIQPIFATHCNGCHAATVTMGSLNLDTYEGVQKGGNHGTIVVPGSPKESRLYTMLTGETSPFMPMDGKVLEPQLVAMVGTWIAEGAPGPAMAAAAVAGPVATAGAVKEQFYSIAGLGDGKNVALGGFRKVTFSDGRPEWTGFADAVRALAVSKDGKVMVAAGGLPGRRGEAVVKDGVKISGHSDCIYAIALSPDAKTLATASYDKLIKLWDVATGKEIRTLKDHIDAIYALDFTPDGKRLISGAADRTVKVWNPETGERLYTMGEPMDGINAVAISPDGKRVVAGGGDKTIRLWALGEKSGELLASQIAHEDAILKLAFSPDGKRIVSTAADRSMKTFDAQDLTELKTMETQPDWVSGLVFSADGKQLSVARLNGSFKTYSME